jgi:uncharacterized membrane protein (DUF485 family)
LSTTEPVGAAGRGPTGRASNGGPVDPWIVAHNSPEFSTLRRRLRGFVFPMAAFFLAWYFLYVLLAAFAPQFMAIRVAGNVNVGLIFGLLEFVSTFVITTLYVRFANRHLDPISSRICEQVEGGAW